MSFTRGASSNRKSARDVSLAHRLAILYSFLFSPWGILIVTTRCLHVAIITTQLARTIRRGATVYYRKVLQILMFN